MNDKSAASDLDPAIERKLLAWLVMAVAVLAFMITAAVQNSFRRAKSAEWVNRAHAFMGETDAILSSLHAAEAAQVTYLLSGDEPTKKLAAENFAAVDAHLKAATELAFENPDELDRLGAISALVQKRIALNKEALRSLARGAAHAAALFTTTEARADMRDLQRMASASRAIENRLLIEHEQTLLRHKRRTEQILYAGGVLNLILLAVAFYVARLDVKARRNAAAQLEAKVSETAAELETTSETLQVEYLEQKWGQAALQRLVSHHELIINSIQEGVLVISRNGHIISANPAAANLTRREAKQLAGKSITSVLLNADRLPFPWEKHFLRSPIHNGRAVPLSPAALKQADGSLIDVQIACHPTRDRENLTGAVITVTPIHSPMQYNACDVRTNMFLPVTAGEESV